MTTRAPVVQLITGGIGRQACLLHAHAYLISHIQKHIQQRKAQGLTPFPSLSIIHITHFLPISTAFKPCVICAFEYVKTTETLNAGACTEIELKQNCDYVNDMYLEVDTPEVSCKPVQLPDIVVKPRDLNVYSANGDKSLNFGTGLLNTASEEASGNVTVPDGVNYEFDSIGGVYTDTQVTNSDGKLYTIRVASLTEPTGGISYTYVDQDGNFIAGPNGQAVTPGVNGFGAGQGSRVVRANYVKGADLIGLKYFHNNVFKVDDNNISEYHSMALVNFRERRLGPTIRKAFDRLIGQEEAFEEISENHIAEGKTSSGFAVGGVQPTYGRQYVRKANGLQTPKPVHLSTKLIIPCIHWFNLERKTSLPVVCMPDGKLIISVAASPLSHLFFPAASLYIQETIHAYSNAGGANGTQADPHQIINRRIPFVIPLSKVAEGDCCSRNVSLVTCNILLDELIHLMIISRIGFNLITLVREENIIINILEANNELRVNQLKWPTEYLHINDQPYANFDHSKPETAENWWRCGHQTKYDASDFVHHTRKNTIAGPANTYWKESLQIGCRYERHVQDVIRTLGVNIYDTYFYSKENRREFYSHYLPYAYSNGYICGDTQHNSMFITFSNIPGPHQPAGFVNLSKTKELFLDIRVNEIQTATGKARLNIQSWCRNFLLIADGSCIVRFA